MISINIFTMPINETPKLQNVVAIRSNSAIFVDSGQPNYGYLIQFRLLNFIPAILSLFRLTHFRLFTRYLFLFSFFSQLSPQDGGSRILGLGPQDGHGQTDGTR
jgi:hypothetical protein